MKSSVAFFLALTIFTSGAVQGQAPSRKANQAPVSKPRNDTLKICQGVPVPDGYVIIAYMTSAACPHGAYLLKKQNDYESSLAVNGSARQPAEDSAVPASNTGGSPAKSTARKRGTSTQASRKSTSTRTSSDPRSSVAKQTGDAGTSASITRPRRVGTSPGTSPQNSTQPQSVTTTSQGQGQTQELAQMQDATQSPQGPPSLIGSQQASATGPPTLGNMGSKPAAAPENTGSDATSQPGPEEVSEGDVLRVDTSLVTVPVSVLDRQGRFISNLKQDDFRIFENGVEQSIAYFEPAEKPFTVALLLDTSASTHFHLEDIREAAIAFAKQLRPQDRVLIVSFNDEVLLLTEATNDLNLVETVIEENANSGNSTRLYDAVDLTIRERLNKIKGRKAIVLFTDGVDTSSQQATYHSTLSEVDELDALIYPIQYDTSDYLNAMQGNGTVTVTTTTRGLFGIGTSQQTYSVPMNNGIAIPGTTKADYDRADRYLHALADKTGGRLYQANDTKQLADAFSRIAEELRRQYSLGYYPKADSAEGADGRRQIRVKVKQSNLAVKARDSYTKSSPASPNK
ncbi:MAG TPA: VWA domain-containing protein [Pyrinomonadaceae bacterium]|nr:VWA domain-containing protein [Pyrinomonadaceae bacterium]